MKEKIEGVFKSFVKSHKDTIKHYNQVAVKEVRNALTNYQKKVNKILDKYGV